MYQVQDGYSQYKEVDLAARTAAASPLELVLVLFAGLLDELERAKSHIEGRRFEKKAQSINKCIDILNALTSSLEFETGGELVVNLRDSMTTVCIACMRPAANCRQRKSMK